MEERIIAFLDVLGFSNDVKSSSDFERIIKILDKVSAANTEGHVKKIAPGQLELLCTTTAFSDSVVISLPIYPNTFSDTVLSDNKPFAYNAALGSISYTISDFISYFLEEGYLVRGGVSCGSVKHDKNVVGIPYIEAVEAEKNFAIMPRVVLCNEILRNLPKSELEKFGPLDPMLRDGDGVFYINWLAKFFLRNNKNLDFSKIRKSILGGLDKCKNNQKNYAKWCWMANHFNTYVPQYLKAYHKDSSDYAPIEINYFLDNN